MLYTLQLAKGNFSGHLLKNGDVGSGVLCTFYSKAMAEARGEKLKALGYRVFLELSSLDDDELCEVVGEL